MTKFIENKWLQLALSILSALFIAFNVWVIFVCINYVFSYNSLKLVFVLYSLIDLLFGVIVFLSRKHFLTSFFTIIALPVSLALLIISIDTGNWLVGIPPLIVNIIGFFSLKMKYTTKVMLTTINAVLYVVCTLAYIIFVTLFGQFPFQNFSSSIRISETVSPNGNYRAVLYEKGNKSDTLKRDIYIEPVDKDKSFSILTLKHLSDEFRIYSDKKNDTIVIEWNGNDKLKVNDQEKTINFDSKYDVTHLDEIETSSTTTTTNESVSEGAQ